MCIKSDFKAILLKLYGQSDKTFLFNQVLSTRGCLPLPWAIYMYKIIIMHGIRKKGNSKRKTRAVKRSDTSLKDLSKV